MSRFIFKHKNNISFLSGVLIVLAFISKFIFKNEFMFDFFLIIASIIGVIPIVLQAYGALKVKVVSIDLLVSVAVIGAFLIKNYEESAIVTFLFLFGAYLEQRTLNKTRSAIKSLLDLSPEVAFKLMADGEFVEVDIDEVDEMDTVLVKTGNRIPVDGEVIVGEGSVNEASITGESIPVYKEINSSVYAGTILDNGTIQIRATQVGEDTTFGKIIELVEEATDSKSKAERFIDQFAKYYTPAILLVSVIVYLFTKDMELAITILVLGCPGALVIGVPVSNVAGIGNGAKNGVLLKGSEIIKDFSKHKTMIFDKTGTLTVGNPTVSNKKYYSDNIKQYLDYLVSVELESDHPLAKAIIEDVSDYSVYDVSNTDVVRGLGIVATVDNHEVAVGNLELLDSLNIEASKEVIFDVKAFENEANSIVILAVDKDVKAVFGIFDELRDNVKEDLEEIRRLGVENLVMLSGDNQKSVDVIAKQLNLTKAYGNMLPHQKSEYVKELIDNNELVSFIGDGINDSPSLALADIGIAMGSGTDVAIETSDVVLINSNFKTLAKALKLSKLTYNNMLQNIIIAVGVVIVLLYSLIFSDWLNMSLGMLIHEGSILVVILNGMRLMRYDLNKKG